MPTGPNYHSTLSPQSHLLSLCRRGRRGTPFTVGDAERRLHLARQVGAEIQVAPDNLVVLLDIDPGIFKLAQVAASCCLPRCIHRLVERLLVCLEAARHSVEEVILLVQACHSLSLPRQQKEFN